jgi:hypothetical protein
MGLLGKDGKLQQRNSVVQELIPERSLKKVFPHIFPQQKITQNS